jgi:hypothetical protein
LLVPIVLKEGLRIVVLDLVVLIVVKLIALLHAGGDAPISVFLGFVMVFMVRRLFRGRVEAVLNLELLLVLWHVVFNWRVKKLAILASFRNH